VRKVGVCDGNVCNLVQMATHLTAGGDSGGPWFSGNTAYGVHRGFMWDPFAPFDRSVFSRLDRMFNALGILVATS
jgi:streptogrisin C